MPTTPRPVASGSLCTLATAVLCLAIVALLSATSSHARVVGMVADDLTDSVVVFDADSGEVLASLLVGPGFTGDCSMAPDQSVGFVTDMNYRVWVIDLLASPPGLAAGPNPIPISNVGVDTVLTRDGRFLLVCGDDVPEPISVVDVASRAEIDTLHLGAACEAIAVCPGGAVLAAADFASADIGTVTRLTIDPAGALSSTGDWLLPVNAGDLACGRTGIVVEPGRVQSILPYGLIPQSESALYGLGLTAVSDPELSRVFVRSWAESTDAIEGFDYGRAFPAASSLDDTPRFSILVDPSRWHQTGVDLLAHHPIRPQLYVPEMGAVNVYDTTYGHLLFSITHEDILLPTGVCMSESTDLDGDGIANRSDNCLTTYNPGQDDADGDGVGDLCDNCPSSDNPDQRDTDRDGDGDACDDDDDDDGLDDDRDNCPQHANSGQEDGDGDGIGDVCDPDNDNDGVDDDLDLYPFDPFRCRDVDNDTCDDCSSGSDDPANDGLDTDGDGRCNVDDRDDDNDGIDDTDDNCPLHSNADQLDLDGDGLGDVCDADDDADGIDDVADNCPTVANPAQADADADAVGDSCENCPRVPNPDQADADSDGAGDACDICPGDAADDADSDGVCGDADNCPTLPNPGQLDEDHDAVGDDCDNCPAAPNPTQHTSEIPWDAPGVDLPLTIDNTGLLGGFYGFKLDRAASLRITAQPVQSCEWWWCRPICDAPQVWSICEGGDLQTLVPTEVRFEPSCAPFRAEGGLLNSPGSDPGSWSICMPAGRYFISIGVNARVRIEALPCD